MIIITDRVRDCPWWVGWLAVIALVVIGEALNRLLG